MPTPSLYHQRMVELMHLRYTKRIDARQFIELAMIAAVEDHQVTYEEYLKACFPSSGRPDTMPQNREE